MSDFFLGNLDKFPIQLFSIFYSPIILLFLQVGFALVESVWIPRSRSVSLTSSASTILVCLRRTLNSLSHGLGASERQFGRFCKILTLQPGAELPVLTSVGGECALPPCSSIRQLQTRSHKPHL
uniref:Uncharacterized protein n=1 Tax=Rousettus aegyptiacus TaxID=9407 RepID=A0A7J8EZP8_ROUAE|nr:hypothetical protein HJG63_012203 [Rousettus aegyptiacus]